MPQYQIDIRIATTRAILREQSRRFSCLLHRRADGRQRHAGQRAPRPAALLGLATLCLLLGFILWDKPVSALPLAQAVPVEGVQLLLLPLGETPVELLTHVVDVAVTVDAGGALVLSVQAGYRLHNPTRAAVTLLVQVDSPPGQEDERARPPQNVSLSANGQPLSLEATGNGLQRTAQVRLEPDQRQMLQLGYTLTFTESNLPAFVYPADALSRWPGRVSSWRVTLDMGARAQELFGPEGWLAVQPDGWTYNGSRLQWLSEESFPAQPLRWQVIHPTLSSQIVTRRQALAGAPNLDDMRGLARLYRQLYEQAGDASGIQPTTRERFYALALNVYTESLQWAQQNGASGAEIGGVHHALAGLYRLRSVQPDGALDPVYVTLMADEAETALGLLPESAQAERAELHGWLADGLRTQLRQAQQRRAWPAALALLDRLAALPAGVVDQAALDADRRAILLQQALQLLEQDDRSSAMALIGATLNPDDLLPPAERRAVFARWDLSIAVGPETLDLQGTARAIEGRESEAQALVDALSLAWRQSQPALGRATVSFDGRVATVSVEAMPLAGRLALSQATPQNIHWSLLRTLLVNASAEYETSNHLIWRRVSMDYSLDLRPVADQWRGMAAGLERESLDPVADASDNEQVRSQLRAIVYRQEAAHWQSLARDSRVLVALSPSGTEAAAASRLWSLSLSDSPQPLLLNQESLSPLRLLLALVLVMGLLFGLAGILWFLL